MYLRMPTTKTVTNNPLSPLPSIRVAQAATSVTPGRLETVVMASARRHGRARAAGGSAHQEKGGCPALTRFCPMGLISRAATFLVISAASHFPSPLLMPTSSRPRISIPHNISTSSPPPHPSHRAASARSSTRGNPTPSLSPPHTTPTGLASRGASVRSSATRNSSKRRGVSLRC